MHMKNDLKGKKPLVVIKMGGSVIADEEKMDSLVKQASMLWDSGMDMVVVHGGGPVINGYLERLDIRPVFKDGLRVTCRDTADVAEMVLSALINKSLVSSFNQNGTKAIGICGKDAGLARINKLEKENDLGCVGRIEGIDEGVIFGLLGLGYLPVVSPVSSVGKQTYNVNADSMAIEIAKAVKADKLIYVSDIPGVMTDLKDKNSVIDVIDEKLVEELIEKKVIGGGMIPKVMSCIDGVKNGIGSVHIIDGNESGSLVQVVNGKGAGTRFERCD